MTPLKGLGPLASVKVQLLQERLDQLAARVAGAELRKRVTVESVAAKLSAGLPLTRGELALCLGVSTKKLQRMEAAGTLKRCPGLGTLVRYASRDVLRLASANGKER